MLVTMRGGERIDDEDVRRVLRDIADLVRECHLVLGDGDADELALKLDGIAGCARALCVTVDEARGDAERDRQMRDWRNDMGV